MSLYDVIQSSVNAAIANAYRHWGETHTERGEPEKAVQACTRALKLNPLDFIARMQRGIAYISLREIDRALIDLTKALMQSSEAALNTEIYTWRGLAYYHAADYSSAISDFNMAIHCKKRHSMAYVYRGMAEWGAGNVSAAISDFTDAIHYDPQNFIAYRHRADVYLDDGNVRQAVRDYRRYVEIGTMHNARQLDEIREKIAQLQREYHIA